MVLDIQPQTTRSITTTTLMRTRRTMSGTTLTLPLRSRTSQLRQQLLTPRSRFTSCHGWLWSDDEDILASTVNTLSLKRLYFYCPLPYDCCKIWSIAFLCFFCCCCFVCLSHIYSLYPRHHGHYTCSVFISFCVRTSLHSIPVRVCVVLLV